MAEPVGITGTAVGIISFGLQLYTGISDYLDAVKGRSEDLETAKQYAKILRNSLVSIELTISTIGSDYAVARHAVEQCTSLCETELKGLDVLLQELKGPMVDPTNRTEQVKSSLRKLSYPFKKKDITRLQDRLSLTNNVLHTAALALQLAISNNTCTTIANLQKAANVVHKTTEDTASYITKQNIALEQASQTMSKSHQEFQLISQRISTSLDTRIDEILRHLRNTESPRSQIIHLLEYPDDLRQLCDAVSNLRQSSKANPRTLASSLTGATTSKDLATCQPCPCATRQDVRRHGHHVGLLFYETVAQRTTYHAPECHLSGIIPTAEENRRTVGVRVPDMLRLLGHTIQFAFSIGSGAGGLTICQSINYTATVDESSSLSFRLTSMLLRLMTEETTELGYGDFSLIAESCIRRLSLCYRSKQASPRDVNQHGESILDLIVWHLQPPFGLLEFPEDVVCYIIRSFISTNISFTNRPRIFAGLPFFVLVASSSWLSKADRETMAVLLGCRDLSTGVQELKFLQEKQLAVFQTFPEIANSLGFNPLHLAILENDEDQVRTLLKQYPSYMNEVNYCGESPVHVAIKNRNLHIISVVVLAANADILNTADKGGGYPIDWAIFMTCSLTKCQGPDHPPQPCNQSKLFDLLLKSKAMLPDSFMDKRLHSLCEYTQKVGLSHLAQRRRDLELLAISKLSAAEIQGLGLCNGRILDHNTARVQHYLAKRCRIPVQLLSCQEDQMSREPGPSRSIYTCILYPDVAAYAISLGFDAGTILSDVLSCTIQDMARKDSLLILASKYFCLPKYVSWMIHRGADIATPIPRGSIPGVVPKSTWAHCLMALVGYGARHGYFMYSGLPWNVAEVGTSQDIVDECLCRCSAQGCTPFVKFLAALDWPQKAGRGPEAFKSYALRAANVLEELLPGYKLGELHYRWTYHAILRYITFSALGLRHTCCQLGIKESDSLINAEEVREIHEEDAVQMRMLEKLVSNFEMEFESHSDLASFLRSIWMPKMQHVCAELNSSHLTCQEIASAERVGVTWNVRQSEDAWVSGEEEYVNREGWLMDDGFMSRIDQTKDNRPSSVEDWIRRLDDIAIDPEPPVITTLPLRTECGRRLE